MEEPIDQKYLIEQQRKFETSTDRYRTEANEVFRELGRQLLLVATVFITVSGFVFNLNSFQSLLSQTDKVFIILAWACFGVSIFTGIGQTLVDYDYFKKWTYAKQKSVADITAGTAKDYKTIGESLASHQGNIPSESNTVCVYAQMIFLSVGILILLIIASIALFKK